MLKKVLAVVLMLYATVAFALAEVEVNSADQAGLDGVKGIGATMSKKILQERKANGDFKDWADLQKRVKGIGEKSSTHFSKAGLRVNGQAKVGASTPPAPAPKPSAPKPPAAPAAPAPAAPAPAAPAAPAPAAPAAPAAPTAASAKSK